MELLIAIAANVLIGLILWALFAWFRRPAPSGAPTEDEVRQIIHVRFPALRGTLTLSADGEAALLASSTGDAVALVQRHGSRWNTRLLQPGDVRAVQQSGDVLTVRLRDFGWPQARLRLPDAGVRGACLTQLQSLAPPSALQPMTNPHA